MPPRQILKVHPSCCSLILAPGQREGLRRGDASATSTLDRELWSVLRYFRVSKCEAWRDAFVPDPRPSFTDSSASALSLNTLTNASSALPARNPQVFRGGSALSFGSKW